MSKNHAQDLRRILAENKFLTLPGVYDCLSGKHWPTVCWAVPILAF